MKDYFKYLTPSEEDINWGLYLNVSGISRVNPNTVYPLREHPSGYYFTWDKGRVLQEYQVVYITEGYGILETREGRYSLSPGSIMVLTPGTWHRYRPSKKTGWVENYIGFNGSFARHILSSALLISSLPVLDFGLKEEVLQIYKRIFEVTLKSKPGYQQIASGDVIKLVGTLLSHVKNKDFVGKPIEGIVENTRHMLHENYHEEIDFYKIAASGNIGYSYFRKMFKKYTGISPGQYLLIVRVNKAKDLLVATDKGIKEIAFSTGFNSMYYFSRLFKEKMGMTPSEMRNSILKLEGKIK